MKRLLRAYRLTPAAGALVFVLLAAVLVLLLGPHQDEGPAFVVIVVVVAIGVTSAVPGMNAHRRKDRPESHEEFGPRRRRLGDVPDPEVEAQAMQRERESYEARDRGDG